MSPMSTRKRASLEFDFGVVLFINNMTVAPAGGYCRLQSISRLYNVKSLSALANDKRGIELTVWRSDDEKPILSLWIPEVPKSWNPNLFLCLLNQEINESGIISVSRIAADQTSSVGQLYQLYDKDVHVLKRSVVCTPSYSLVKGGSHR